MPLTRRPHDCISHSRALHVAYVHVQCVWWVHVGPRIYGVVRGIPTALRKKRDFTMNSQFDRLSKYFNEKERTRLTDASQENQGGLPEMTKEEVTNSRSANSFLWTVWCL